MKIKINLQIIEILSLDYARVRTNGLMTRLMKLAWLVILVVKHVSIQTNIRVLLVQKWIIEFNKVIVASVMMDILKIFKIKKS